MTARTVEFTNTHGERFRLEHAGVVILVSGDEVDMMVPNEVKTSDGKIPLFNANFGIWSNEELAKLGKALIELAGGDSDDET